MLDTKIKLCTQCDKELDQPIQWGSRCFCPHCDIEIFKPRKIQEPAPLITSIPTLLMAVLLKSFLLAIPCLLMIKIFTHFGLYTWFENQGYVLEYVVFGCLVLLVIAIMMYEKWQDKKHNKKLMYQYGVDSLDDYKNDAIGNSYSHKKCPQCQSQRMTDLYFYKKVLTRSHTKLPKISIDESQFVGCLKCHVGFQIVPAKLDKTGTSLLLSMCIFGVVLFLFYHEVVTLLVTDSTLQHTIGYCFGMWFYMFLMITAGHSRNSGGKRDCLKKLDC